MKVMVRYHVKPDRVAENAALVHAVCEEMAAMKPDLAYACFRSGDEFVHVATYEGESPLQDIPAFRRFREGLEERTVQPPVRVELTEVGVLSVIVHMELHTDDAPAASAFYGSLLGWESARSSSYLTLDVGGPIGAGVVECGTRRAGWLPYVAVDDVDTLTARAVTLGASVLLTPREGPAGWRSVLRTPAGGEVALWQLK